ncbi:MAG: diaminobutyrate acetyltransferase [Gammaproteobacteria bacterium HGW-Gammaproteobacteria-14]|nr:MAG: diaminobutyrate acetyltransferase [Gammaproteobacteria bacterium HGW-Gammaproteobacteria-14]
MFAETAAATSTKSKNTSNVTLRKPDSEDGADLHALVSRCKPLDENSTYCNLLQCTHFADTCVAAEMNGELVGFISGYIPPKQQNVLFVWQVAVDEKARGMGLASKMLSELADREECSDIQYIETTITPDNDASWNLFRRFADSRRIRTETFILFDSRIHFSGAHKDEHLLRIGPFNRTPVKDALNH